MEVTREAGIKTNPLGYGLGVSIGDINNDGWPDIYVGNDFHENDYLYINQGNRINYGALVGHTPYLQAFIGTPPEEDGMGRKVFVVGVGDENADWVFVGDVTEHVMENIIIDNYVFGVAAVGRNGNESVVVFGR